MGTLISGLNAAGEALRTPERVNRVYVAQPCGPRARALADAARESGVRVDMVPLAKLNHLAGTGDHQGVAVDLAPLAYADLDACIPPPGAPSLLLILDRVQHPRNLGMLLRTAAAAGASGVIVPERGGALLDDDVVRASAGAVLHVPVARCGNLAQTLRALRDHGYWVYGMAGEGRESVFTCRWADRCALVMGNETEGLRPATAKACDLLVRIPLCRDMDSLNVSVAAGVALFQAGHALGMFQGIRGDK